MKPNPLKLICLFLLINIFAYPVISFAATTAQNIDFNALPAGTALPNKPNVLINLSVETPMQGAAYNDQFDDGETNSSFVCENDFARAQYSADTGLIGGNNAKTVGRCYHKAKIYLGYFDSKKCYTLE